VRCYFSKILIILLLLIRFEGNRGRPAHWVNLFDADRLPISSIMTFIDSTERRCQDEQIWIKAHYDALTGLPNRGLFWERLSQSLLRARRDHQNMAVL
jgi:predicted signal transduction protein with EAL and GGDEF domain